MPAWSSAEWGRDAIEAEVVLKPESIGLYDDDDLSILSI